MTNFPGIKFAFGTKLKSTLFIILKPHSLSVGHLEFTLGSNETVQLLSTQGFAAGVKKSL